MKIASDDECVNQAHRMDCGVHVPPDKASPAQSSLTKNESYKHKDKYSTEYMHY